MKLLSLSQVVLYFPAISLTDWEIHRKIRTKKKRDWSRILEEKENGERDFFKHCRFLFCALSFLGFLVFLIWMQLELKILL